MTQLTDLIPRTVPECRRLLRRLRGKTSFVTTDRSRKPVTLDRDQVRQLAALVENQIGEKTPEPENKKTKEK